MRTRIKSLAPNLCEVIIPEGDGKVVRTVYWSPKEGGDVYDVTREKVSLDTPVLDTLVCDGLAYHGMCLYWNPNNGPLVDVIRREYHAARQKGFYVPSPH